MKPHERRQTQSYPYYKVATFDPRSFTYRDGKIAFNDERSARESVKSPGKYRLSVVTADGRRDMEPFTVT